MATEFELKYRADPGQQEAILRAYPGGYAHIPMSTTYYDTPGGGISARRWTLRHRREGERDVCTLKTPGSHGARGEWEAECGDIHTAVPILSRASGHEELEELTAGGVVEVCSARFRRQAKLLEFEDFTAELAVDRGVLAGAGREEEFSEVELELKSGSAEALVAFAAEFQKRFALELQPLSKFARAIALAQEG